MALLFLRGINRLRSELICRRLRRRGHQIGKAVRLVGSPIISTVTGSRLQFGDAVHLISDSRLSTLGVNHPVILRTLTSEAEIVLGDNVGITGGTICAAYSVSIGAGTMLGANVLIADTDFHPLDSIDRRYAPRPAAVPSDRVKIGPNVFIGTGAIILKGSTIGANAVIGAGAVVSGTIEANSIAAGSPARVVRSFSSEMH